MPPLVVAIGIQGALHKPARYQAIWLGLGWRRGLGGCSFVCLLKNPIVFNKQTTIPLPRVILKVLFGGIVIPAFIKAVTLTYSLIDILVIIKSINVSSKRVLTPTLRTSISRTESSISLKGISICIH